MLTFIRWFILNVLTSAIPSADTDLSSLNILNFKLNVLNVAPLRVGGVQKSIRISAFILETFYWRSVPKNIQFKILPLICKFLIGSTPSHLRTLSTSVTSLPGRSTLDPAAEAFSLCSVCGATGQSRSFTCVGTSIWNYLPLELWLELLGLPLNLFQKQDSFESLGVAI